MHVDALNNPNLNCIEVSTLMGSGSYNVDSTATLSTNCNNNCQLPTAINNRSIDGKLLLYPNPMTQSATITLPGGQDSFTLLIYNMNGKVVRSQENIVSNELIIERDHLNKGVYLYHLISASSTYSGRFIVE